MTVLRELDKPEKGSIIFNSNDLAQLKRYEKVFTEGMIKKSQNLK